MRLILATVSSAVLLAGCSWFGGQSTQNAQSQGRYAQGQYNQGQHAAGAQSLGRCQVYHAKQALPRGCHPSEVTIATSGNPYGAQSGGFPQQPNFSAGYGANVATGGFGSHANVRRSAADYHVSDKAQPKRPKWRGQLSVGGEKSFSGNLIDLGTNGALFPGFGNFNPPITSFDADNNPILPVDAEGNVIPRIVNEGFTSGTPGDGLVTTTTFTAEVEQIRQDDISFEDAYSTPLNIRGGFEYILTPKTTVFANAGYVYAEGERSSAVVQAELQRIDEIETFEPEVLAGVPTGNFLSTGTSPNVGFIPNVDVVTFDYEFSDLERIDLEAGARHYLNPILTNSTNASITPFVGGSIGAARYNDQTVNVNQRQLFLERAFESGATTLDFFDVLPNNNEAVAENVALFDSQWVPTGTITAGVEWQATPRTAIAFESGLRYEGGREDVNSLRGDDNISIPFTIRGSYNF